MFKRTKPLFVFFALVLSPGCKGDHSGPVGEHGYALQRADGKYDVFMGRNIAQTMSNNGYINEDSHPFPFHKITVPDEVVEEVLSQDRDVQIKSFSMEDKASPISIVRRLYDRQGALKTVRFTPGDPWVTGVVQIWSDRKGEAAGRPMASYEIIQYSRLKQQGGPDAIGENIYSTGLGPDEHKPSLKYVGPPDKWPPVPGDWE